MKIGSVKKKYKGTQFTAIDGIIAATYLTARLSSDLFSEKKIH
jgi:hypothetical protein